MDAKPLNCCCEGIGLKGRAVQAAENSETE